MTVRNWPKDKINWPKDNINWPKDKINWPKDKINSPKDKFSPGEIQARLLTYGKERTNLNKKHEVCVKI